MLAEIALEAFRYFDRTTLEELQMHSRYLRDLVNRHARTLPLRYINSVQISYGRIFIRLLKDDRSGSMVEVENLNEQDLEKLFHQLNNAFVDRLTFSFRRKDLTLPYYLRANASDLQCQIGALRIEGTSEAIDYALVDFLGACLKPQIYVVWMGQEQALMRRELCEDYAMLLKHDVLRGNVKHLECELGGFTAVPNYIFPALFGDDVVETCAITTKTDPLPWIGQFIEMFERAERGTHVVRSVTLLHMRFGDTSPLRRSVEPLGQPRRTDVPTPRSALIKEWARKVHRFYGRTAIESTVAELYVFENATSAQKLEVLVWTIEPGVGERLLGLNYACLLQMADK